MQNSIGLSWKCVIPNSSGCCYLAGKASVSHSVTALVTCMSSGRLHRAIYRPRSMDSSCSRGTHPLTRVASGKLEKWRPVYVCQGTGNQGDGRTSKRFNAAGQVKLPVVLIAKGGTIARTTVLQLFCASMRNVSKLFRQAARFLKKAK